MSNVYDLKKLEVKSFHKHELLTISAAIFPMKKKSDHIAN